VAGAAKVEGQYIVAVLHEDERVEQLHKTNLHSNPDANKGAMMAAYERQKSNAESGLPNWLCPREYETPRSILLLSVRSL